MATSVETIINAALNRNQQNDAIGVLLGEPEAILFVSRFQQDAIIDVASRVNPDIFGYNEVVVLSSGEVDLSAISPAIGVITLVEISDKGSSNYVNLDPVKIVPVDDRFSEEAPRMIEQHNKLLDVSNDFAGVASIRVWYSYIPAAMDSLEDPANLYIALPDQHSDVLVTALARYLAVKDNRSDSEVAILEGEATAAYNKFLTAMARSAPKRRRYAPA